MCYLGYLDIVTSLQRTLETLVQSNMTELLLVMTFFLNVVRYRYITLKMCTDFCKELKCNM